MRAALVLTSLARCLTSGRPVTGHAQGLRDVETIVSIDGACRRYEVGPAQYGCSGLMYLPWRRGRTGYLIPTVDGGSLMLTGGSDSRLTPERYVLDIDRMTVGWKGASPQAYPAKGRCTSVLSTDGRFVRSLECDASDGTGSVILRFTGANTPVTVKHF